jgi:dTDP-4-dehydrorhamnose 3,5-epimerase
LKIIDTALADVKIIQPEVFEDHRGIYVESYNEQLYKENGININFVQDDYSISTKDVLRGLHGDNETWKLISCPVGEIYCIVLNYNKESSQFREWESFIISENNRYQILVPPKFANGHLILSGYAMFNYKQSTYYNPKLQFTIKWNDPKFNFRWPVKAPILSKRDEFGRYC